jgi:histidinol phosphatase-like PHP family hydrolase
VGEPGWAERYPAKTLAMFDYLVADAAQPKGQSMTDNEIVDRVVGMIENLPIDILANPTWLPTEKALNADYFWTDERMQRIVDAAATNGVAFEINIVEGTPSEAFIQKAKAAGARFTIGTGVLNGADPDDWSYLFKVQAAAKLAWRDMFVPGHLPGRAQ